MRLSCQYDILVQVLQDIASVVEDALADVETQNIIFRFTLDEDGKADVKFVGYSPSLIYKRMFGDENAYSVALEAEDVDDSGVAYFQIRSKDILGFLGTYKSLKRTKVDYVVFEPMHGKIRCTVREVPVISEKKQNEIDEARMYDPSFVDPIETQEFISQCMFQSPPMKPNIIQRIEFSAPEEGYQELEDADLKVYTETMFRNLENSNTPYGTMYFMPSHVGVATRSFSTVMKNFTANGDETSAFSNIGLSYKAVSFIDKVVCRCRYFQVAKTGNKLFFKLDTGEACMDYISKGLNGFDSHRSLFKKDSYFVLDKLYFRDILKRLALSDASIKFCVHAEEGRLTLENDVYSQDIEFLSSQNIAGYENLHFTVMPANASAALLDTEKFLPDEDDMYVYLCSAERKDQVFVYFSDKRALWFSMLKTKAY